MAIEILTFGIPFIFVLAIVYGALDVSSVFKNKGVKMIIALAVSAASATYQPLVTMVNAYLPYAAIFFIIVFFIGIVTKRQKDKPIDITLVMIVLALLLILIYAQGDTLRNVMSNGPISFDNIIMLAVIVIFALMFLAAYKKGK